MKNIISLVDGVSRNPLVRLKELINFVLADDEHLAIVGPNGSGKSILIDTLLGKYPLVRGKLQYDFSPSVSNTVYDNVKYITFRDSYGVADAGYYYQQRWNSQDQESVPETYELLGEIKDEKLSDELFDLFQIKSLLEKKIVLLSSGELRKFQLIKALLSNPRVLIIDNPFIGLDIAARKILYDILKQLSVRGNLQIILVLSILDDIPDFIIHVIPVENLTCGKKITRDCYFNSFKFKKKNIVIDEKVRKILELPSPIPAYNTDNLVSLNKITIRYGDRIILKDLSWNINRGEKWALSGENGSGKSTLLSLICADNPQSYACDISLFGRKRGTGESIWDIKKRIGYVSPEMHRAYLKNIPTLEIVASGLHDSIGLYKRPQPDQLDICKWWMDIFGILDLKDKSFLQLSSGEQRLALLARAFVKDPELLILDEPLHGLDTDNRKMVKRLIDAFGKREDKTIIMVTHYEEELPGVMDKRLVLRKNE